MVADDELFLSVYTRGGAPVARATLCPGLLPDDPVARKAAKPDFECLVLLPGQRLLALGSGGKPTRERGALIGLADAMRGASAHPVDLGPLYARLRRELPVLNLEGAAVSQGRLRLFQRGSATGANVIIDLALDAVLACLDAGRPLDLEPLALTPVALGQLGGVALGFTDASPLGERRLVFTAAAEDTDDPIADGQVAGSVVGVLGPGDELEWLEAADGPWKLEGVHAAWAPDGGEIELLLVADPDDRAHAAPLLGGTIPLTQDSLPGGRT